jgi:carbonic anhydrase
MIGAPPRTDRHGGNQRVSTTSPHTAKNVFFSCIDDRLVKADFAFLESIGDAFHARIAGGGAAFADEADRHAALKQITASYKINHITDVYLQSHTDCGAYRLAGVTFQDHADEIDRLYADLERAERYIHEALLAAGAADGEVTVHLRVVDPGGRLQSQPSQHTTTV